MVFLKDRIINFRKGIFLDIITNLIFKNIGIIFFENNFRLPPLSSNSRIVQDNDPLKILKKKNLYFDKIFHDCLTNYSGVNIREWFSFPYYFPIFFFNIPIKTEI